MMQVRKVGAEEAFPFADRLDVGLHFTFDSDRNNRYFMAYDEGRPVGIVQLTEAAQHPTHMHVEYLEVLPEYRHRGAATELLRSVFTEAAARGLSVTTNGFTSQGQHYLEHIFRRLGGEHRVETVTIGRV